MEDESIKVPKSHCSRAWQCVTHHLHDTWSLFSVSHVVTQSRLQASQEERREEVLQRFVVLNNLSEGSEGRDKVFQLEST
jgi:hypothetical protein